MNINEKFYHEALRNLESGSTSDDFAAAYANASKEDKNSSIWQSLYDEGKTIFQQNLDVVTSNGKIDEEEFNLFSLVINFLKNLPNYNEERWLIPQYKGESDMAKGASGNSEFEIDEIPTGGLDSEVNHLKPIDTMTREERIDELNNYYSGKEYESLSDEELAGKLRMARDYIIRNDKGSKGVDYHIGTFSQNALGNCSVLSQIAQLSDDELKNLVHESEDENGKYYLVIFPMDINNPENSVKIYENELSSGLLNVDGWETPMGGFSVGDDDVTLFEMAYVRRFGTMSIEAGETAATVQNMFSYPDTPRVTSCGSEVTEEKLMEANSGRATLGLKYWDASDESMSYMDTCTDSSGITASYAPLHKLDQLKAEFKSKFPQVNEELYKDLKENEFMEFSFLFIRQALDIDKNVIVNMTREESMQYIREHQAFNPRCKVKISNGDEFVDEHAYIFRSYNPATKEVILSDPYNPNEDKVISLEIAQKFFIISN